MRLDWSKLDAAMEECEPVFWWRDDDVIEPSPALDRLLSLTAFLDAPLTLAAIPARATPALAVRLSTETTVSVAIHGWAHENHAPGTEKKSEFGAHRPLTERVMEAERGLAIIANQFGENALAAFIPPWNRIAPDMPEALAQAGYCGLSIYGNIQPQHHPLPRFDAHLDPIDWRGTRSAVDPQGFVDRIAVVLTEDVPIGLMTHHLAHDTAIWDLVETVTRHLTDRGARWTSLPALLKQTEGPLFTR